MLLPRHGSYLLSHAPLWETVNKLPCRLPRRKTTDTVEPFVEVGTTDIGHSVVQSSSALWKHLRFDAVDLRNIDISLTGCAKTLLS